MKQPILALTALALAGACAVPLVWAQENNKSAPWTAPTRATKKKNPIPAETASIAAGKSLYLKECLSCHGSAGKGDGSAAAALERKPGNLSDPKLWQQTDGALFWKLTEGNKPMPSFAQNFTEDQRWQVINYVRTLAPPDLSQQQVTKK